MLVDGEMNFSGILGATGGSEFSDSKQNGTNYRQDHAIPPPRMGLLGGGEGSMNTASSGWVNNSGSGNNGSGWGSNVRTSTNNSVTDLSSGTSKSDFHLCISLFIKNTFYKTFKLSSRII